VIPGNSGQQSVKDASVFTSLGLKIMPIWPDILSWVAVSKPVFTLPQPFHLDFHARAVTNRIRTMMVLKGVIDSAG
jgi:hypothetical protein